MEYSEQQIFDRIADYSKSLLPTDSQLILFGSHARHEATAESDWDLLLLLNKEKITDDDYDRYVWPLVSIGWSYGEYFSVKAYTNSSWEERKGTPLYKNIEREGVRI
ncbi:MAG: nucleotidyltransferase domain-containing protein [Bacteroidales bacterium]|nr:nucleotidyltransferase domain-containing protein [Bacteroidales bacterium]MBP5241669.1 nucleotidyltransferase domain-containing protein [Bacteroidales bacterium]